MTANSFTPRQYALVLYKQRPAIVTQVGPKKISIRDEAGKTADVRAKDVTVLHPGPIQSLSALASSGGDGEVLAAWELMAGETTSVSELAELAYGEFTPASAYAIWQQVAEGHYFTGTPDEVVVRTAEELAAQEAARAAKEAEEAAWSAFQTRIKERTYLPEDEGYLADVVELALEQRDQSRTMQTLGLEETPQAAHGLLLAIGYWDEYVNPYPTRFKVAQSPPAITLPDLPDEERRDLTHLVALAIDDEGNQDPDDALSLDGSRLWVHVADVAALVPPDSEADLEARERSMNLYLPEGTVPMLPPDATVQLGLGLTEVSPALSFGLDLDEDGNVTDFEIVPSRIRVTRLSYAEAEARLDEPLLGSLNAIAQRFMAKRLENGAVELNFPEARIRIIDSESGKGEIDIRRLPPLASRILVREAMLMAGQAAAHYAIEHEIPMPFTVQQPPDVEDRSQLEAETLAEMFAVRKLMKPGRQFLEPGPHSGLGLDVYLQTTSPLRRYFDLLVHQQLRAHVRGEEVMDAETVADRLAGARSGIGPVRLSERFSNAHWTVAYLQQRPDWSGTGIVVDHRRSRSLVIIPELAYETEIRLDGDVPLDTELTLQVTGVNLPEREARFRYQVAG